VGSIEQWASRTCKASFAISVYAPGASVAIFHNHCYAAPPCKRNIEMTPLCKIEVTHRRVLGSREVRRGGVVDEQAGVQPA
jgi:hypothetical protein